LNFIDKQVAFNTLETWTVIAAHCEQKMLVVTNISL